MKKANPGNKELLTVEEAIEYWGLKNKRFHEFVKEEGLPFIAGYHERRFIIRDEFEKYLTIDGNKEVLLSDAKKRQEA